MGAERPIDWQDAAASTLAWWTDAGVDVTLDDVARDWLAPPAPAVPSVEARRAVTAEAAQAAEAALPNTVEAFVAWRAGQAAPETAWGSPPIVLEGPHDAPLMIVTDFPEDGDGAAGWLLSGPEGRLLDRMLAAIGTSRAEVLLAPLATVRPLTGQLPRGCEPELERLARHLVALIGPPRLLLLGQAASRAWLGTDAVERRGCLQQVNHGGATCSLVATFHPRFLIEKPVLKAEAWKDLLLLGGNDA